MGSFIALLSSVCYGTADFLGGYSARRASIGYVVICSQVPALVITGLLALALKGEMASTADWLWSAAAGLSIAAMLPALYMALSIGPMAVVAPVTALIAIVLPVLFGVLVAHEQPSAQAYAGFLLGGLAVAIVSGAEHGTSNKGEKTGMGKGLLLAAIAGIGIASMYICLKQVTVQAGMLALTVARSVSLTILVVAAVLGRRRALAMRPNLRDVIFIAASGGLDALATALYKSALGYGEQLSVVATLVSLYPLTTVVLATTILRERLTWQRVVGVLLALSGIGLIVSG